jgi:hypothetical protein
MPCYSLFSHNFAVINYTGSWLLDAPDVQRMGGKQSTWEWAWEGKLMEVIAEEPGASVTAKIVAKNVPPIKIITTMRWHGKSEKN